ncbi:phage major capsid protein [Actinomadura alba]|uniref:Phage major capsid protein n=1 Tax=Actinomadura alba TaxID=406431 RepID=A0ABR7LID5_9ACTN|nr:phage major capsid protein [Actinomadura alba]MBC6464262.1 phage major capsid protein [Actinomadura alba]
MSRLQTLLEQRANAWATVQDIRERLSRENRDASEDEDTAFRNALDDVEKLSAKIADEERAARLESIDYSQTPGRSVPEGRGEGDQPNGESRYGDAFQVWMRGGSEGLTAEERTALHGGFVDTKELRAQGVATGAAGGYLVPQGFRNTLIETMKFYSSMRAVSEVINTDSGQTLPWPTNDDTANVGAILAENTQMTQQDLTLGQAQLGAYMYTSKIVLVSFQLLQDSVFNLDSFLARKLGERIGRIQNTHFTTGTGSSQPLGIQTNATVGKQGTTGQTTTVIYDDLIDLIHSVNRAYRNTDSRWMMADSSLKPIRKLKDSQNRPLWEPSVQVGVPDSLLGYGLEINDDMPAMAASAKSVLFGDFRRGYVIRDVLGVQLLRLTERYADFLQVGFAAYARTDATLQDAGAIRAYQNAAS